MLLLLLTFLIAVVNFCQKLHYATYRYTHTKDFIASYGRPPHTTEKNLLLDVPTGAFNARHVAVDG